MSIFRNLLMRTAWYVKEFGDWLYFLGLGGRDYIPASYCKQCGKWSFEEKGD